jgi:hypothetical protein
MEIIFSVPEVNRETYIAFFDLDKTITKAISGRALVVLGHKKGLFTGRDFVNAIFLSVQVET